MLITKKSAIILTLLISAFAISATAQSKRPRKPVKRPVKVVAVVPASVSAGAIKTPSGLIYLVTRSGTGVQAKAGDTVSVHYTGTLTDGTRFDTSKERGQPIEFKLGTGRVIKGWDEGIAKMKVGEQAIFVIPSAIGYGPNGRGPIPGGATMIFIVELVDVKP